MDPLKSNEIVELTLFNRQFEMEEQLWKDFFQNMNSTSPEKFEFLEGIQVTLNSIDLKITPEIEKQIINIGYVLLKTPEQIMHVKQNIGLVTHDGLGIAYIEATPRNGLLTSFIHLLSMPEKEVWSDDLNESFWRYFCSMISNSSMLSADKNGLLKETQRGLQSGALRINEKIHLELLEIGCEISDQDLSMNRLSISASTRNADELFIKKQRFDEAASIADKWAMKVMEQEWGGIKKNIGNLNREQIYFCNRFMKMGLAQFELSFEMKQLMQRVQFVFKRNFNLNKLSQMQQEIRNLLNEGIKILECNRDIWENDQNADFKIIDTFTEPMIVLNKKVRESTKIDIGTAGLKNLGNSCYMNASLQLLFIIPDLVQTIQGIQKNGKDFLSNLCNLFNSNKIDNQETLKNLRFHFFKMMQMNSEDIWKQQDAHEFLNFILDELNWNPLETNTCLRKEIGNERIIDKQKTSHLQISFNVNDDATAVELQKIIDVYSAFEYIEESVGEKAIQIINSPEYLFLHLVRFEYEKVQGTRRKKCNPLHHHLDTPLSVGEGKYQVIGWINHIGKSMDLGHYTTFLNKGERWLHYNDEEVSQVFPERIGAGAYIVLLKKL